MGLWQIPTGYFLVAGIIGTCKNQCVGEWKAWPRPVGQSCLLNGSHNPVPPHSRRGIQFWPIETKQHLLKASGDNGTRHSEPNSQMFYSSALDIL